MDSADITDRPTLGLTKNKTRYARRITKGGATHVAVLDAMIGEKITLCMEREAFGTQYVPGTLLGHDRYTISIDPQNSITTLLIINKHAISNFYFEESNDD